MSIQPRPPALLRHLLLMRSADSNASLDRICLRCASSLLVYSLDRMQIEEARHVHVAYVFFRLVPTR